jgi:hypothetical protein
LPELAITHHIQDGSKRLVLHDRRIRRDLHDGWLDVHATTRHARERAFPTRDAPALFTCLPQGLLHVAVRPFVDQRTYQGPLARRISKAQVGVRRGEPLNKRAGQRLVHDQPA